MSHPTCPKCGQMIQPGSAVDLVFSPSVDPDERRILSDDEVLVAHAACPRDGSKGGAGEPGALCESCGEENVFDGVCEICGAEAD